MFNKIKTAEIKVSLKILLLLTASAYIFSMAVRYIWVWSTKSSEFSYWNDQLMINTNDGYAWAEGARDILRGVSHFQESTVDAPVSKLTALVASISSFSLESVILYLPAVLGSLLIVPILLIGRVLKNDYLGFAAALLGAITVSYYNRTMVGYFDTDMLVIVLPTLSLWGILLALSSKNTKYLAIAPLFMAVSIYWHNSGVQLANAFFIMMLIYTLLFERKNPFNYKLISIYVLALTSIPILPKLALIAILSLLYHFFKEKINHNLLIVIVAFSALVYLWFGGLEWIIGVLNNAYITRLFADDVNISLKFFDVVQTVREAGQIPFEVFAQRISGSVAVFFLACIGYILLLAKERVFIITLPMVVLGFFAYAGGLRFTVFAVPVFAVSFFYLVFVIANLIQEQLKNKIAPAVLVAISAGLALYPNIAHVKEYKVPTVFNKQEVAVLDILKNTASREDYALAWWDYGYPIRFYSDVKTLVDGGKHDGSVNFPVSYALTYPQTESANMARLAVEYTERGYKDTRGINYVKNMMEDYNYTNPNEFLMQLSKKEFALPQKSREVYFYLPYRMLDIYQTVRLFSNIDLRNGNQFAQPFLFQSNGFNDTKEKIILGNGIEIDKRTNSVNIGNQRVPLSSLLVTAYDNTGKLRIQQQIFDVNAPLAVVYMKSYNRFLIVDQQTFNSTYFQLFVLENYDTELFEPVIMDPLVKVYKLKK